MPSYNYRALDKDGKSITGTMDGETSRAVVQQLEERGLKVTDIVPAGREPRLILRGKPLTWEDIESFNEQLLALTRGGLPLPEAIALIGQELGRGRLKTVLKAVREDLESGHSLETAFERHPGVFPPVYLGIVRAGERTGNLSGVLETLSRYTRQMVDMKNSAQEALFYPVLLAAAVAILLVGLFAKIAPAYEELYRDFGGRLPAPTEFLFDISHLLHDPQALAMLGSGLLLVLFAGLPILLLESTGVFRHRLKLWTPLLGRVFRVTSLARFCQTLATLLDAHVPMLDSLSLAGAASGNRVLAEAVTQAAQRVANGFALSDALEHTGYFEHGFCWLLRNAEQRGETPRALFELDSHYESTVSRMRSHLLAMMTPVTVVALGLLVGFVVVALYLPLFSVGDIMSGN